MAAAFHQHPVLEPSAGLCGSHPGQPAQVGYQSTKASAHAHRPQRRRGSAHGTEGLRRGGSGSTGTPRCRISACYRGRPAANRKPVPGVSAAESPARPRRAGWDRAPGARGCCGKRTHGGGASDRNKEAVLAPATGRARTKVIRQSPTARARRSGGCPPVPPPPRCCRTRTGRTAARSFSTGGRARREVAAPTHRPVEHPPRSPAAIQARPQPTEDSP